MIFPRCIYCLFFIVSFETVVSKYIPSNIDCAEIPFDIIDEPKLVFAHVIFRHGERNIFDSYPNDPYKNESFWPGGFAALTNAGKRMHFELGQFIKNRYEHLLGEQYSPKKVYIRSTDTDRTLMSAQCNAAGLFPAAGEQIWNENLRWQPIPIHTIDYDTDYILNDFMYCPRYEQLLAQFSNSAEFQYQREKYQEFIEFLEVNAGKKLPTHIDVMFLMTALNEERERGLVLPEWTDKISEYVNETWDHIIAVHMESFSHWIEMKKIRAGFMIKEMLNRFQEKIQNLDSDRSLWMYSAHDTTIVKVLNALNLYEFYPPPYASSLFFELYSQNDEYFVKLFYKKSATEELPLDIPNCGVLCPLNKFYDLYAYILPTESEDYESLCRL